jgi:hypothetical protein
MQLVPYLGIDAACLDAHVKTLGSSAQEFDLAPIARQSLPGLAQHSSLFEKYIRQPTLL